MRRTQEPPPTRMGEEFGLERSPCEWAEPGRFSHESATRGDTVEPVANQISEIVGGVDCQYDRVGSKSRKIRLDSSGHLVGTRADQAGVDTLDAIWGACGQDLTDSEHIALFQRRELCRDEGIPVDDDPGGCARGVDFLPALTGAVDLDANPVSSILRKVDEELGGARSVFV